MKDEISHLITRLTIIWMWGDFIELYEMTRYSFSKDRFTSFSPFHSRTWSPEGEHVDALVFCPSWTYRYATVRRCQRDFLESLWLLRRCIHSSREWSLRSSSQERRTCLHNWTVLDRCREDFSNRCNPVVLFEFHWNANWSSTERRKIKQLQSALVDIHRTRQHRKWNLFKRISRNHVQNRTGTGRVDAWIFQCRFVSWLFLFERMITKIAQNLVRAWLEFNFGQQPFLLMTNSDGIGRGEFAIVVVLRWRNIAMFLLVVTAMIGRILRCFRENVIGKVLLGELLLRGEIQFLFLSALIAHVGLILQSKSTSNTEAFLTDGTLPRGLGMDEFRLLTDFTDNTGFSRLRMTTRRQRCRRWIIIFMRSKRRMQSNKHMSSWKALFAALLRC